MATDLSEIEAPSGDEAVAHEAGLARQLTSRQLAMIAIGGAIGTGLFLGSSLAVRTAGPSVIITYIFGAVIAFLLMSALSEMSAAHPAAGSFGLYAEVYVSRWAGFVVRYTYWFVQCIAIGGEATAVAIYCKFWFPSVPGWMWIVGFSLALIVINTRGVGSFGEFEYWFSMVKVVAIVLFIIFGIAFLTGIGPAPAVGLGNYTQNGGFFPFGYRGVWMALVFVIFSYMGTEVVAVTAGEAKEPEKAVPRAMRSMVLRLVFFYLGAITVLIGVAPWNRVQSGSGVTASPFVTVFQVIGIPGAAHIVNFVVVTAALSSMNCNLYLVTRMMFSLSRGGYAPEKFGRLNKKGTPINALLISAAGLLVATAVAVLYPENAFVYLFGVSLFGGLFVWLMIFVTHLFFRRKWEASGKGALPIRMKGYPYTTAAGAILLTAIIATTWWVEGMRITIVAGLPWLAFISIMYLGWSLARRRRPDVAQSS